MHLGFSFHHQRVLACCCQVYEFDLQVQSKIAGKARCSERRNRKQLKAQKTAEMGNKMKSPPPLTVPEAHNLRPLQ